MMNYKKHNILKFWILAGISIALFVGGFFVPPLGIIDGSVLKAGGILLGFYVVGLIPEMIREGKSVKLSHGDASIEICDDDDNAENEIN